MTVATPTEIAAALSENSSAPFGRPRNVRSEELAELATQTGDRPLTIRALQELIRAHEYGGERDRMLVPFARVLRMWDENPADFDASTSYRLHWQFKWVSSGMVDHPGVSLTIIRQWLDEMESRYRRAGYGLRAVHSGRHVLAAHLGDTEAAERAYDDWVTADRDMMTDCHACERNGQGDWKATTGRGAEALDIWQPVLDGSLRCDEEPHRVLAQSLLPLARLGLLEEARANHLRGYRMARRNPNLRIAIGKHIEFAALTGNEARGLEILAEHADWLEPSGENANARRAFLEGVAILLQRLHLLGYAETSVPAPRATSEVMAVGDLLEKVTGEIADIVRLFDERNANTTVSRRSQARLSHPAVVEVLPLGIRSAPIATPGRAVPQPPPVEPARAIGIADLIDEAVRLSDSHHPRAAAAWERVASAGVELRPDIEARVAESRALAHGRRHPTQAHTAFLDVAARFARLGRRRQGHREPGTSRARRNAPGRRPAARRWYTRCRPGCRNGRDHCAARRGTGRPSTAHRGTAERRERERTPMAHHRRFTESEFARLCSGALRTDRRDLGGGRGERAVPGGLGNPETRPGGARGGSP